MTATHDFWTSLAYSHRQASEPWWEEVYRRAFPDLVGIADLRHDGWHQRAGRDRAIVLKTGKTIYVDEKARSHSRTKYGDDILVEVWSVYPDGKKPGLADVHGAKLGWGADCHKECDWLAYAWVPDRVCCLLPYLGLRAAYERYKHAWVALADSKSQGFDWKPSQNSGYTTWSIAIPTHVLKRAIADAVTVHWQPGVGM